VSIVRGKEWSEKFAVWNKGVWGQELLIMELFGGRKYV
jgi:hypothetical protein